MKIAVTHVLEFRQPRAGAHVCVDQFGEEVVDFLVLRDRMTRFVAQIGAGQHGGVKRFFFCCGVGLQFLAKLLEEFTALGAVPLRFTKLFEQLAMLVVIVLEVFENL